MKKFYNSLAKENNRIYGIVRCITIKIDEKILERILHISTDSIAPTGLADKEVTVRLIVGENVRYVNGELLANQLSMEMRLLYSFITHILFPKVG